MKRVWVGLAVASLFAANAGAQQHAHEHGVAQLRVALEDKSVLIELESPLDNLLGFEHAPKTDAQKQALADLRERLLQPGQLFRLADEAACQLKDVQLKLPYGADADHDHEHEEDHDHEHEEDHDHDHGEADHDHGDADHDEDHEHADAMVSYRFDCAKPEVLKQLDVSLNQVFPRMREIRAAVIGPSGQQGVTLKPGQNRLQW